MPVAKKPAKEEKPVKKEEVKAPAKKGCGCGCGSKKK
jgi:hypothetical protein